MRCLLTINLGSISDGSEFDAVHSRTASDSSTSKLYTGAITNNDYCEDPYAKQHKKWRSSTVINNDRANSYLPYSHHQRDPNQKAEPIYIEEYIAPTSTTLGVDSMLQDAAIDQPIRKQQTTNSIPDYTDKMMMTALPEITKRRRQKRRLCGLRYRTVAFIVFLCIAVIVVIWYFVWPRIPNFSLDDVDNVGNIQVITNTTKKSMSTNWMLNFTADNSDNWVPTRFSSIDLSITDDKTQLSFGNGTRGPLVLPPKKKSMVGIPMTIYYASEAPNDTTFQDLYNACGVQVTSNSPFNNQQDSLNVTLHITYHITGIVWPTTRHIPVRGLMCPTT